MPCGERAFYIFFLSYKVLEIDNDDDPKLAICLA